MQEEGGKFEEPQEVEIVKDSPKSPKKIFTDHQKKNGAIKVSGVDIKRLALHQIRRSIGLISQDPILIGKTIREAIDPLGKSKDEEIATYLQKFQHLFEKDKMSSEGCQADEIDQREDFKQNNNKNQKSFSQRLLEMEIGEGSGANLSLGARQLLSILRVLILRPKIVLMDEITSNLDKKTEILIGELLNEALKGVTMIAIAHKLDTVKDFDRILVIEEGKVGKEGTPEQILGLYE